MIGYIRDFVGGAIAIFFFAYVIHSPKRTLIISSLTGGFAYLIFRIFSVALGKELIGYFVGSFLISASGEICARIFKIPANVLIFPSILLLVPGTGLYRSMLYLVQSDYDNFLSTGIRTVFISVILALGIAVVNLIARKFSHMRALRREISSHRR